MIGKVLDPFLEDLKKYLQLEMRAEANQLCMGLLLGCYRFEHEAQTEFKEWAPDEMYVFAESAIDIWKEGHPSRVEVEIIRAFIEQRLNGRDPQVA
jgi:1,4-alpha-glucan branching enzyme